MANDYIQASFALHNISAEEEYWLLHAHNSILEGIKYSEEEGSSYFFRVPGGKTAVSTVPWEFWGWTLAISAERIAYIYCEEFGNLDAIEIVMREFLIKFRPTEAIVITWAEVCSKPRTDHFGGGALIVTAQRTSSINVHQWANEELKRIRQEQA
jgi:hypothetical protein